MSEAARNTHETLVAGLSELGFRVTLIEGGKLHVDPASRLNEGARRWLEAHRSELIAELRAERVESTSEVANLARYRFPVREDLPPPPPPPLPDRDPLVKRGTNKVTFFKGDWRRAWPRDFKVYNGGGMHKNAEN